MVAMQGGSVATMKPVSDVDSPAVSRRSAALAVVVLYRMLPEDSPALRALHAAKEGDSELAERVSLLVWDNTPGERQSQAGENGDYHHDPTNPGLSAAYNSALRQAKALGCTWLILLDQDTTVTQEYLREALAVADSTGASALVPRLSHNGTTVSPFHPSTLGPVLPIAPALHGIAQEPLQAFNSGSVLRVSAMEGTGGFDAAFPLDYLDHATFAALQRAQGSIYVLNATLEHDLSTHTIGALDDKALARQADILAAEHRFIAKYGTQEQRRMMPIRTVRHALSVLIHKRDLRHALLIVKTALARLR